MPFFSVIIPVYNRYEQVQRAIDSVLAQTFRDYELIVIDDGSTDSTGRVESLYSSRLRYIRQANMGVSAARNHGIRLSRSPHITFLDSDDEWNPGKLMNHKRFIDSFPLIMIHQCDDIWIRDGQRVNMSRRYLKDEGDLFLKSLDICSISPSSVSIASAIFEKYGLFDESMPACEDYDLWLRITPFEKTGLITDKLVTRYSGHEGQLSAAYQGMDRFRLYSILKLLDESGEKLSAAQTGAAEECARKKFSILKNGSDRRGNTGLSAIIDAVRNSFTGGYCTRKYYQSLLRI